MRGRFAIASAPISTEPQWARVLHSSWLAVTLAVASAIELLLTRWSGPSSGLFDFHMYLNAAWAARLGGSIYPNPSVGAGAHAVSSASNYFIYPVPFVVLLLPLTLVPLWVAGVCARFGEIVLLALTAWSLIHALTPGKGEVKRAAWAAVVLFHLPIIGRIESLGQVDTAVLALVALSFLACSRYSARGEWWAGVALGAAALLKPYIGVLALFYLWKRQWRAAAGTMIASGAGVVMGALALGLNDTLSWLRVASSAMTPPHITGNFTVSLFGLAVRSALVYQPGLFSAARPVLQGAAWALLGLGLLLGARYIHPGRSSLAASADQSRLSYGWEFALAITLLLLTFPTIEDLHTSLIAIPVVLLGVLGVQSVSTWLRQDPKRARALWLSLAAVALYLTMTSAILSRAERGWFVLLPIWKVLSAAHETVAWLAAPVALVLLAWIYRSLRRGKVPWGEGFALLLWSLAAALNVNVGPIEYGEQAGPWQPHLGTAVVGLRPLAGLVPLGIVATVSIALIAANRLDFGAVRAGGSTP